MNEIKCPKCGASHYYERYQTATAMAYYQEYIDGILQPTNDPNIYTHYCTCCECGANFYYTNCPNKIETFLEQIDYNNTLSSLQFTWNADEMYEYKKKRLKEQIARLQQELQELEFNEPYIRGAGTSIK